MYLVTGGHTGSSNIASTEVFHVGDVAWSFVGNLPMATSGLSGVSLGNRLLMTGTNSIDDVVV